MKLALLQCNFVANDVENNIRKLVEYTRKAGEAGADICVTSELALCGGLPTDELLRTSFIMQCDAALRCAAAELLQEKLPPLLLGAPIANPVPQGKPLHNCAVLLRGGKVAVIARKVLLPASGVQEDYNYFEPGVACGMLQHDGWRFAVSIGEDLWNDRGFWGGRRHFSNDPVEDFMQSGGADAIINLSGVPFCLEEKTLHQKVLSWAASKYRVPVIAVNQVGGIDEAIYPGGSMLVNAEGEVCRQAARYSEELLVADLDKDTVRPQTAIPNSKSTVAAANTNDSSDTDLEELRRALVLGVRDFVVKSGAKNAVLGLSGGIDSALVAAIAVDALGKENVLGVMMPSPHSSEGSLKDAERLAANLGIKTHLISIEAAMNLYESLLEPIFSGLPAGLAEENLQARIRATLLMAISNKFGCLLLNTGNKSEVCVGYCTLYGDACGAVCVIGDLFKHQVYALARWYNTYHGQDIIPEAILTKAPSAELRPGQKDSDSLPDYPVLDAILHAYVEKGSGPRELCEAGFAKADVERVINLVRGSEFKRRQLPPVLRISMHALNTSGRMPIASSLKVRL